MSIAVDTANAAMSLAGGVLALLAAIVTLLAVLLPKDDPLSAARKAGARIVHALPQAISLTGTLVLVYLEAPRTGLLLLAVGLTALSLQFLVSNRPLVRIEVFVLVFQSCMFTLLTALYFVSQQSELLGRLVNALGQATK